MPPVWGSRAPVRDLRTVPLFHWGPAIKLITGITDRVGTNESNMRATLDRLKAAAEHRVAAG